MELNVVFEKGVLQIEIENSYNGKLDIKEGKFLTTKTDKRFHGIGLSNVKRIVEKYNGLIEIQSGENVFLQVLYFIYKMFLRRAKRLTFLALLLASNKI